MGDLRARKMVAALCKSAATGIVLASAASAYAQEGQGAASEQEEQGSSLLTGEIVVTAQKRTQDVQDVGIAITTYSGEQLDALGVEDSTQLAAFSPGVHIGGSIAGQNTQFTIRGVTQIDFNDIVEAPNAAYLDEGYIAIAQGQTFALVDIDRVELLKGPQGTLFGRNATGGLVHYISRKPTFDGIDGYVDVSYGIHDSPGSPGLFKLEAAIGGPLTESLAARGAVLWRKQDDLLRNNYPDGAVGGSPGPDAGGNFGDDDTLAGRFTLLFDPGAGARATLSFNGARSDLSTAPYQQKPTIGVFEDINGNLELVNVIDVDPNETRAAIGPGGIDVGSDLNNDGILGDSFGRPVPGGDFFGYVDPDGDGFRTSSDFVFDDHNEIETYGINLKVEIEISDDITLTSISDFKDFSKLLFLDVDAGPGNQSANYAGVDATTIAQELRLNGQFGDVQWVAGGYYLNIDADSINGLKFPVGSVVPGAPFDLGLDASLQTDSYSVFGQVEWEFADQWNLIVGARLISEDKDYFFQQAIYGTTDSLEAQQGPAFIIGPDFGPNGPVPFEDETSDTLWAGKAQLEFRPNDDLLLYAGVNRGVKAGSFNAQLAGGLAVPVSAIPYDPEVLTSYEGGFKYTFPDGRTRLNASAYYYDYKDYQSFLFTGVSGVVINADAKTYGIEGEFVTSPLDGLDLSLSGAWVDATVKDVPLRVNGPIVRDVESIYAPEFQGNAIARYEWDAFGGFLAVATDIQYSSSYFYNLRNFDADKFDSYVVWNAGVQWTDSSGNWVLSVDAKNITDERAGVQGFDLAGLCGCNEVSYKPPRFFSFGVRRNF